MPNATRRGLLATALAAPCHPARAQPSWPDRPIRMVVAWPPGGGADTPARLLAPTMQRVLGQPIIIENRSGASGAIGAGVAAQAAPDGYTVLADTSGIVTNSLLVPGLGYDSETAFAPVTKVVDSPLLLVVRADDPAQTLPQLIARLKAAGGRMTFGSSGAGSGTYLAVVEWLKRIGAEATHVAYRGGPQSILGLVGGDCTFLFSTLPQSVPLVREGRLRALAVSTPFRLANLPAVPTLAEQGSPGFAYAEWLGFFVPTGTPAFAIQRLYEATAEALRDPVALDRLGQIGMLPVGMPTAAFQSYLAEHRATLRERIREGTLKRDE